MRYRDLAILQEGAIDTSAIALAADKLLHAAFLKIVSDEARNTIFSYDYDQKKLDQSYNPNDDEHHDRAYAVWEHAQAKWQEKRGSGAYNCIYTASRVADHIGAGHHFGQVWRQFEARW